MKNLDRSRRHSGSVNRSVVTTAKDVILIAVVAAALLFSHTGTTTPRTLEASFYAILTSSYLL